MIRTAARYSSDDGAPPNPSPHPVPIRMPMALPAEPGVRNGAVLPDTLDAAWPVRLRGKCPRRRGHRGVAHELHVNRPAVAREKVPRGRVAVGIAVVQRDALAGTRVRALKARDRVERLRRLDGCARNGRDRVRLSRAAPRSGDDVHAWGR